MQVSAWKGGTYGIRVGKGNADSYFPKDWKGKTIAVEIGGQVFEFRLSETFWTTSPEFRGAPIKRWLAQKGLLSWPSGSPPGFELQPLGGNRFRLVG
jgi:hypothetical protein